MRNKIIAGHGFGLAYSRLGASCLALAMGLAAGSGAAVAQDVAQGADASVADAAASEGKDASEIVVTGTLIRGSAPVGANSITLDAAKIQEVGAISTNQLLATVPQISNFFNKVPLANLNIAVNQVQTARPSIRDIGNSVTTTSPTLVLINGHRIAGVGVTQSSVDPDMIPTGAIGRVDVNTEGGSATYGADAVAGVINFITMRRFNGVKVDANYGFADNYAQWSAGVTAGKEWATGSAFISYSYAKTDALFGRDRSYANNLDYTTAPPYQGADLTCSNPNLTLSTLLVSALGGSVIYNLGDVPYAAPNFVQGTANRCDNSKNGTLLPKSERHGVFFGLNQELGDKTTLDFHAFYGRRFTEMRSEAVGTIALGSGNPAASLLPTGLSVGDQGYTIAGLPVENRALVKFSFAPVLGSSPLTQTTSLKEWGADLEITHNFSDDWQLKVLGAWSESDSRYNLQSVNQARLDAAGNATTPATAINPLDITQTSRALIDDLIDNELAGQVRDRLIQLRAIVEGRLFNLPGGEVRLAAGYEFMSDYLRQRIGTDIRRGTLGSLAYNPYTRNVHSVFGELRVPIFGEENAITGIHSLVLSAAGRFDHYSDFGNTFNPKFGVTYEPVKGFRFRGNWGTSFTAPSVLDQLGGFAQGGVAQTHPFQPDGVPPPANSYDVIITGTRLPLKPQKATTWSVGVDVEPTRDLRLSGSYYHVKFTDIISIPTPSAGIFTDFPTTNFVSGTGLDRAQVEAFASQIPGLLAQVTPLLDAGQKFYSLIDFRVGNYGVLNLSGFDFSVNYRHDTGFGSFDLGLNGNIPLQRDEQVSPTGSITDRLVRNTSPLSLQGMAGVNIGQSFRAQVTVNHSAGYQIDPTPTNVGLGVPVQTSVGSFTTTNLFFKYDVPSNVGVFKNLSFTLNVDNLFDTTPPLITRSNPGDRGFTNGFTIGRMFLIGASKRF